MTSPAIKLARECGIQLEDADDAWLVISADIERFYAKAQAAALRDAYNNAECLTDLSVMADKLERT